MTRRVLVSRDVVFEEGQPHRTSASVGEKQIPLFDTGDESHETPLANDYPDPVSNDANNVPDPAINNGATLEHHNNGLEHRDIVDHQQCIAVTPVMNAEPNEPRRSIQTSQPSQARLQSMEYNQREIMGKAEGKEWATNHRNPQASSVIDWTSDENIIACLTETKASHHISHSYRHAMATDPDRWMKPMQAEIKTLKAKHTWDLVEPPPGANIMDSMWIYDIKWDGEGNRIKDKARLVGKGYTQLLGIDYNETWAGVTRLESVRMTASIAAKLDLKLWRIDFVGAYLNSLTKEDIYMKPPEGFVKPGFENYVCKLVHTIYGMMQGGHDWYETLSATYTELGYTTSRADPCVRFKKENGNYTLTDTYTDDVFGASNNDEEIKRRKNEIGDVWEVKDVGETEYFLGIQVQQDLDVGTIRLTQRPYWEHVLN
jgi:hypothetical protein